MLLVNQKRHLHAHEIATGGSHSLSVVLCVCSQDSYPLMNVGRRTFATSSQCPRASRLLAVSRFITLLKTGIDVEYRCSNRLALCSGVQDEGDNQAA
jgi:hypothetical protein